MPLDIKGEIRLNVKRTYRRRESFYVCGVFFLISSERKGVQRVKVS